MEAVAEGEMRHAGAVDIEGFAIDEFAFVAIGGADEAKNSAACRDFLTVELRILRHIAADRGAGRLEAQQLLDGLRE